MKRRDAISIIKEIGFLCPLLNPSAIFLEQTDDSNGYEIHVEAIVDDKSWEGLKILARKHDLGLKLNDRTLVIYRPLEKEYRHLIFA